MHYPYINRQSAGTWLLIGDSQDPVWRWSAQTASTVGSGRGPRGPLSSLQEALQRTSGSVLPNPRPPYSAPSVVSYLEQQLLASKALGSSQEYVHWLMALVSFILTQGMSSIHQRRGFCLVFLFLSNFTLSLSDGLEKRLRIILDDLMGPSHGSASKSTWDSMILGIRKHKLLNDVLGTIGGHLRWQRLYLEYSEQLAALKNQIS